MVVCEFPGVRFYIDGTEVCILTFFPSGMPKRLERVGIHQFLVEARRMIAEKRASATTTA